MAQVTRTGMHYARVTEIVVKRRKENEKRFQCQIKLLMSAWFSPALKAKGAENPWVPMHEEGQEIIFYGEMHGVDGGRNMTVVDMLMAALPWGGKSLAELQAIKLDGDGLYVQVDCKSSNFNGKTGVRAEWIHPETYMPPERAASVDELQAMDAEWNSVAPSAPKMLPVGGGKPAATGPRVPGK